jgi:hypothetical protein
MTNDPRRKRLCFALVLGAVLCALSNCATEPKESSTGGETHFLTACDKNESCGNALACLCGICTRSCTDNTGCQSLAVSAECVSAADRPVANSCPDSPSSDFCDVPCTTDEPCLLLSNSLRCDRGFCRSGIAGDAGSDAGTSSCVRGQIGANEVLFIGDSFIATSHQIAVDVVDLARRAGSLAATDQYRDNSSLIGNSLALATPSIADQYTTGQTDSPVKVVIMNGGGADVLAGTCASPPTANCQSLVSAAAAVAQLLSQMAQDGVQNVVYFFYPDPVDAALQAKMDLLRPLVQDACTSSPVPCHWLDLRPTFAGHYADYVLPDGMNPTDVGSAATASAIWTTMQQNCIAQ